MKNKGEPVKIYVKNGDSFESILTRACALADETGLPVNVVHTGVFSQLISPGTKVKSVIDTYRRATGQGAE